MTRFQQKSQPALKKDLTGALTGGLTLLLAAAGLAACALASGFSARAAARTANQPAAARAAPPPAAARTANQPAAARAAPPPAALKIISLLEEKKHAAAAALLEKEIRRSRSLSQKGHYALLLTQIPLNAPTKKPRHEYAFTAARHAEGIPSKKRMQLWIEAADGFFKSGDLKRAERAYKQAFLLAKKRRAKSEIAYILYKRAWTRVNQKDWRKAFHFLLEAEKARESRIRENILFDIGRIWAESQYHGSAPSLESLAAVFRSAGKKEKALILKGMIQGMGRKPKLAGKQLLALSKNQEIFSHAVNYLLTGGRPLIPGRCGMIKAVGKAIPSMLERAPALSALNSCSKALMSKKSLSRAVRRRLKNLSRLYLSFERRGAERWPLALIYERLRQNSQACAESLRQLGETAADLEKPGPGKKAPAAKKASSEKAPAALAKGSVMRQSLGEAFRLCRKAKKPDKQLAAETARGLLSSRALERLYTSADGEWENILFHFLKSGMALPSVREALLEIPSGWGKKDLPALLFLSHVKKYHPDQVRAFLSRFSPRPARAHYIDLLLEADFLKPEELAVYMPLKRADSYRRVSPWLQKALSGELEAPQTEAVVKKLLENFPEAPRDKKTAALFLAIHYLKADDLGGLFSRWERVSGAFEKTSLAVELFEKSLSGKTLVCGNLSSLPVSMDGLSAAPAARPLRSDLQARPRRSGASAPAGGALLGFISSACRVLEAKEGDLARKALKPPAFLRGSALAMDFVFLSRIQARTAYLERGISRLEDRTSRMIMSLKRSISGHQKRKWASKILSEKAAALLQRQIGLFEGELGRLAAASEHGDRYRELKQVISEWR